MYNNFPNYSKHCCIEIRPITREGPRDQTRRHDESFPREKLIYTTETVYRSTGGGELKVLLFKEKKTSYNRQGGNRWRAYPHCWSMVISLVIDEMKNCNFPPFLFNRSTARFAPRSIDRSLTNNHRDFSDREWLRSNVSTPLCWIIKPE